MSSYVTKDRIKKDFPQVETRPISRTTAGLLKDGQATRPRLLLHRRRLPEGRQPAAGRGTTLTRLQTAVITQTKRSSASAPTRSSADASPSSPRQEARLQDHGVLKDLPKNSQPEVARSAARLPAYNARTRIPDLLGLPVGLGLCEARPGTDVKRSSADAGLGKAQHPDEPNAASATIAATTRTGISSTCGRPPGQGAGRVDDARQRPQSIATFAIIALLILGMAVVNFTNLATARASQRAREVACARCSAPTAAADRPVRRGIGFDCRRLDAAGAGAVELLVKPFAAFLEADLKLHYFGSSGVLLPAIGLVLLVGVLGGLYPASSCPASSPPRC
jgi:putative ABC transport system permease protein